MKADENHNSLVEIRTDVQWLKKEVSCLSKAMTNHLHQHWVITVTALIAACSAFAGVIVILWRTR
jgi:hypothetical protein